MLIQSVPVPLGESDSSYSIDSSSVNRICLLGSGSETLPLPERRSAGFVPKAEQKRTWYHQSTQAVLECGSTLVSFR
jgi:hypothetical protein